MTKTFYFSLANRRIVLVLTKYGMHEHYFVFYISYIYRVFMGFASFHSIFHIQSKFQVDTNITRVRLGK